MHQKYPLPFLAALMVLAIVLQWWPRGRPGIGRALWRAFWVGLNAGILSGALWLVAYDPDAVVGSPKALLQACSVFLLCGSGFFTIVFGLMATAYRLTGHLGRPQ